VTLTEIKQILAARDLKLTKSLGQNFLHDQNQVRRIIAAAELTATDNVLEIGPGLGPLTEHLVEKSGKVLAIEKDRRLAEVLREKFSSARNFELIEGDALDVLKERRDWAGWKLVANLPYSVASPILVELAQATQPPERMVATLQLEVVQRIVAQSGSEHYGLLSLLLQLRYKPRDGFKISSTCFFPPPDVDSACITLTLRREPLLEPGLEPIFTGIIKRAFSQRRKMMFKLLKQEWPEEKLTAAYESLSLSQKIRAEEVSLIQFARLTTYLGKLE